MMLVESDSKESGFLKDPPRLLPIPMQSLRHDQQIQQQQQLLLLCVQQQVQLLSHSLGDLVLNPLLVCLAALRRPRRVTMD